VRTRLRVQALSGQGRPRSDQLPGLNAPEKVSDTNGSYQRSTSYDRMFYDDSGHSGTLGTTNDLPATGAFLFESYGSVCPS
jgi:hypothetical protein